MVAVLAHAVHYLLITAGLVGVGALLLPQAQAAARGSRRTTFRPPASPAEHEERIAALRVAVQNGTLTTATAATAQRTSERRDGSTWRAVAVVSSGAAAGVHAAVFPHHLEESVAVGAFFLLVTLAQAAWACLVVLGAGDRRLLVAGIGASVGLVVLWVCSRTAGVGWFGVGREPIGAWDLAAVAWELAVVAACVVGLRRPLPERQPVLGDLGRAAWAWVLGSGLILVVLTLTASQH